MSTQSKWNLYKGGLKNEPDMNISFYSIWVHKNVTLSFLSVYYFFFNQLDKNEWQLPEDKGVGGISWKKCDSQLRVSDVTIRLHSIEMLPAASWT